MSKITWSDKEVEFLTKNYMKMSDKEVGKVVDKTVNAVEKKRGELGLLHSEEWSETEVDILLRNYGHISMEMLQMRLKRTQYAIEHQIKRLKGTQCPSKVSGNLPTTDVAKIMGRNDSFIRRSIAKREIPHVKPNRKYLIKTTSFWTWLESNLDKVEYDNVSDLDKYNVPQWYLDNVEYNKKK